MKMVLTKTVLPRYFFLVSSLFTLSKVLRFQNDICAYANSSIGNRQLKRSKQPKISLHRDGKGYEMLSSQISRFYLLLCSVCLKLFLFFFIILTGWNHFLSRLLTHLPPSKERQVLYSFRKTLLVSPTLFIIDHVP
jgi:hypothetical protein